MKQSAHWPPKDDDRTDTLTVVFTSMADTAGKRSFWIKWYQDGRWRAQHFRCVPDQHVAKWAEKYKRAVFETELE